jgi:hypothetical protein
VQAVQGILLVIVVHLVFFTPFHIVIPRLYSRRTRTTTLPNTVLPTSLIPNAILPTTRIPNAVLPTTRIPNAVLPTTRIPNAVLPTGTGAAGDADFGGDEGSVCRRGLLREPCPRTCG